MICARTAFIQILTSGFKFVLFSFSPAINNSESRNRNTPIIRLENNSETCLKKNVKTEIGLSDLKITRNS